MELKNDTVTSERRFFGDDSDKRYEELSQNVDTLAKEVCRLATELRAKSVAAAGAMHQNMRVFEQVTEEVESVSKADVASANQLIEHTLALSLELQGISHIEIQLEILERTLDKYEAIAKSVLDEYTR